ncbi:Mu transposase C-terminal domain-containing protein [Martelella soudanensis]|uniref:Mu transposase C-terminal domain-containing protein n=1 Tax=unclassified Martelella TaxID=2629616 RepID=UPI001FEDE198|nr:MULTISPECIES: Mu transposase C-terminal domain-containing protein [unclassified Martelella]
MGRPPIAVWRKHEGEIPLRLPQDRLRFWLTFLPVQERTLRPTGIHLFGLRYWSAALSADVGRSDRRALLAKGRCEVDTRAIVRTVMTQRELIDTAIKATATVRRGRASPKSRVDDRRLGSLRGVDSSKPVPFVEDTD